MQAQILNLLNDLQRDLELAYLFITHNIAVVDYLAHEVAVMYLGRIVERGTVDEVLRAPRHPYTQALLAAVPRIDGAASEVPAPGGRHAVAGQSAGGLPFPSALPAGATNACRRDVSGRASLLGADACRALPLKGLNGVSAFSS